MRDLWVGAEPCTRTRIDIWLVAGVGASAAPRDTEPPRIPLYVIKARLYLQRLKAFERTMQTRMETLEQSIGTFATQLYLHHISGNRGNVILSPLSAYASLAMALTASQGVTKREVLTALLLEGEGRGVHASLQRALTSLRDDDTDDVNDNIYGGVPDGGAADDDAGLDLSQKDLEDIVRNDYVIDNSISYNTGQTQIRYSSRVKTGPDVSSPAPEPGPDMSIRLAHGMFHSEQVALSQHFSNRLVSLYGAPPMAMQPDEPETSVNLWVDAETRGAVPSMLAAGSVSQDTLLLLIGAFSFWGAWKTNFDEKETLPLEFRTGDGDSVFVQCMYRTGNYSVKSLDEVSAKVLELPYANARYSLFLFLPRSSGGMQKLERGLKTHSIQALLHDMPEPGMTIVMLPKFRLLSTVSLGAELKLMGVRKLFTNGQADLRRMTDEEKSVLFLNDFVQYAALEVDEGTNHDDEKMSVEISSDHDHLKASLNAESSNSSDHFIQVDDGDDGDGIIKDDDDMYDEYDYEDYEDYEEYDYDDDDSDDSTNYFITDKPFVFVVIDKQYNLILLMGRVTNPLP